MVLGKDTEDAMVPARGLPDRPLSAIPGRRNDHGHRHLCVGGGRQHFVSLAGRTEGFGWGNDPESCRWIRLGVNRA